MSQEEDSETDSERTVIRTGREFEREYRLSSEQAGAFLVEVGEKLQEGDEVTLAEDEWELPFPFGEPVDVEIDYEGVGEPELEIEIELPGRTDETGPRVE